MIAISSSRRSAVPVSLRGPTRAPVLVRKAHLPRGGSAGLTRKSIGARRRCFVLEIPRETPDGFGGVIRTYEAGPMIWGAMTLIAGTERHRADRPEQAATYKVVLPYREGVTAAMRLTLGPRRFAIRSACDPDGGTRDLVCLVEEVVP